MELIKALLRDSPKRGERLQKGLCFLVFAAPMVAALVLAPCAFAQSPSSNSTADSSTTAPVILRPAVEKSVISKPFTLAGAVEYAELNYPTIKKGQAQVTAAKDNVTVQKLNEYLPDSLLQYQDVMASHNKLSQTIYGSPVFPALAGPGFNHVGLSPLFFSGAGFSLDWAPLDFGLHKARIDLTKAQAKQVQSQFATTLLDVQIAAANAFLDVIETIEQIKAAQENINSFQQFSNVVHAQVGADLRPGADASLADAQLSSARNTLIRAELAQEVALATLANLIGLGGEPITVEPNGIASTIQTANLQPSEPIYTNVPILQVARGAVLTAKAQRHVLNKEYYPVMHFLGGWNVRGAGLNTEGHTSWKNTAGVLPVIPNYQAAFILNWNFLDAVRLHAEKKVQDQRIIQQQQEYNLVLQNLKTEDVRSRARIKAAIAIAENMPVQVQASMDAARQAEARYKVGLSSVSQVAEAQQVLAQSRMQEAVARVGIWKAMLAISSVHGDLKPFLTAVERVQRGL